MEKEKFEFHLKKIEMNFPNKSRLNAGEMLQCIGMSRATFNRIINANDTHKIPVIGSKEEFKRDGAPYYTYTFDVYDITVFLVGTKL